MPTDSDTAMMQATAAALAEVRRPQDLEGVLGFFAIEKLAAAQAVSGWDIFEEQAILVGIARGLDEDGNPDPAVKPQHKIAATQVLRHIAEKVARMAGLIEDTTRTSIVEGRPGDDPHLRAVETRRTLTITQGAASDTENALRAALGPIGEPRRAAVGELPPGAPTDPDDLGDPGDTDGSHED